MHQLDEWKDAWDSESNKDIDIIGVEEHGTHWYIYLYIGALSSTNFSINSTIL